jgi:hypothetical protein
VSVLLGRAGAVLRRRPRTSPVVLAPVCGVVGLVAGLVAGALTVR